MKFLIVFILFGSQASVASADGYLDWVPEYKEVQTLCESSLTDLMGAAGDLPPI